jgi:pullulanase
MLRSKPLPDGTFDHNSYKSPDSVNNLKWNDLNQELYQDTYRYYQGLIAFRKTHPALRLTDAEQVNNAITPVTDPNSSVLGFQIEGGVNGEQSDGLYVIFNPKSEATEMALPEGKWTVYINGEDAGTTPLGTAEGSVSVDPISAMVLVKDRAVEEEVKPGSNRFDLRIAIVLATILIGAGLLTAVIVIRKKKK